MRFKNVLFTAFCLFCLNQITLNAQTTNIDHWMGFPQITEQTPDWAKRMYSDAPNVFEVDRLYNLYFSKNKYQKTIDARNYKHWRTFLEKYHYVQVDGSILIPDAKTQVEESRARKRTYENRQAASESSSNTWTTIGPFVMKDGNNVDKSNQSCIVAMDHSELDTNLVVNVNQNGAIFKSTDDGQNWTLISTDEDFLVNTWNNAAITIHPTNTDTMLMSDKNRIYRTTDGGATWDEMGYINDWNINCIEFKKDAPHIINISSEEGIYRSTDSGVTWTQIMSNLTHELIDHPTNHDIFYALVQHANEQRSEFFKSTDGGATYSVRSNGWYTDILDSGGAGRMSVTDAQTGIVYAFVIGKIPGDTQTKPIVGVFKSSDEGESWTKVLQHDDRMGVNSGQGYYDLDIGVSDIDSNIVVLGSQGYWRTTDGFITVNNLGGGQHADIQELQVHGSIVWMASDGGMDRYDADLTNRQSMNNGMYGSEFWGFEQAWNEDFLTGSYYHNGVSGSRQSFYGTGIHRNVAGGEPSTSYISLGEVGKAWFSYPGGRIFPETVDGTVKNFSYSKFPNEAAWSSENRSEIVPILPYYDHHILGKDNTLYISKDGGASFDTLHVFGTNTGHKVTGIEISRSNPDTWYIYQRVSGAGMLWRTTDAGQTFAVVPQASGAPTNYGGYIAVDANDENTFWVAYNRGSTGNNKIYKTTDGGTTWTNLSTDALDGYKPESMVVVPNSNGGVYLLDRYKIFYKNDAMGDWADCTAGLPLRFLGFKLAPFYAEGKLRMASLALGAWEMDLVDEPSAVIAEPIVATDSVFCSRDTIQFESYSVINHNGATWAWSFSPAPLWIDDATKRNPRVVFGANGNYSATLTISDANGNTDSKTVNDIIKINSQCEATGERGMALRGYTDGDWVVTAPELTNVTHYTMTAWIKPDQNQEGFGGIVTNGKWCAHCNDEPYGLCFDYWGGNLHYRWSDYGSWASTLSLYPTRDKWNYVAMTVTPDTITVYLNNQVEVQARNSTPVDISNLYFGHGFYSNSYRGELDEVTVWTRALSADEIYKMRHITKDMIVDTMSNLVGYYQFNEIFGSSTILDNGSSNHGNLTGGANIVSSTAPIGGGVAQVVDLDGVTNIVNFANAGAEINRPYCNIDAGKMVISRLDVLPDSIPNGTNVAEHFWTVDYYGNSTSFSPLENIELTLTDTTFYTGLSSSKNAVLYQRPINEHMNTWERKSHGTELNTDEIEFGRNAALKSSVQILVAEQNTYFDEINIPNACQADTVPGNMLTTTGASNSYAHIPHNNNLNLGTTTDFSVTVWVKTETTSSDATIAAKKDWDSGANPGWVLSTQNGHLWANIGDGSNRRDLQPSNLLNDGAWHHVAMTCDRDDLMRVYLDGVEIASGSIDHVGNIDNTLYMAFGADSENDYRLAADIEEFSLYNAVLTQDEIRKRMHLTQNNGTANLIAYYQFNETSTSLFDRVGTNHGYLQSTAASFNQSGVPIGSGVSHLQNVTSDVPYLFGNTGVTLDFTSSHPNGEVVVSRLNVAPDTKPAGVETVPTDGYWIINNYGTNSIEVEEVIFDNILEISSLDAGSPSSFGLYKRATNAEGATWGNSLDDADAVSNQKITFSTGNGISSFSQFAISDSRGVLLNAKVMLQGAYTNPIMQDGIRSTYLLQNVEPYATLGFTHINGGGEESCAATLFNNTGNDAVIDWVLVELRDKTNAANILYTRSALLQADGDIVDTDGVSALNFGQAIPDDYYVAIRHRNHLGAMTLNTVTLSGTAATVDFTSVATYGVNAQADLGSGIMGLWAGDGNGDGKVIYQGADSDLIPTSMSVYGDGANSDASAAHAASGYYRSDINMDGISLYIGVNSDKGFIQNLILTHPDNLDGELGFVVWEQLP